MNRYILLTTFLAGALLAVATDVRAAGKITVSRKDCATIVTHTPSADVTYQPALPR
jgi:hypothetical protein